MKLKTSDRYLYFLLTVSLAMGQRLSILADEVASIHIAIVACATLVATVAYWFEDNFARLLRSTIRRILRLRSASHSAGSDSNSSRSNWTLLSYLGAH